MVSLKGILVFLLVMSLMACRNTTSKNLTPDAAVEADAHVCQCPPAPVCESCSKFTTFTGVMDLGVHVVGTLDCVNDGVLPLMQFWIFASGEDEDGPWAMWRMIFPTYYIESDGFLWFYLWDEGLAGRDYRLTVMWSSLNPGIVDGGI